MGFLFSKSQPKPKMINKSIDTQDDLFPSEMEKVILYNNIEKAKKLSQGENYPIVDCIFLAAKMNRIEILKYLTTTIKKVK